jgi:hypothetical protein
MRAKKAAGGIERFPGGRKAGAWWITPRMWERQEMETTQALEPPPLLP